MKNILPKTYINLLKKFISFKSVSTDSAYTKEMIATATWLHDLFKQNRFKTSFLKESGANPIVFADYHQSDDLETILVYGHYDVQPADKKDGWSSDPFTLTEENGRLIARGANDNKGQIMVHIATIFELIHENNLQYNVKFFIEGDEENGSGHIESILKTHKDKLSCDHILLSDGETTQNHPTMDVSFRGGGNMTITLQTGRTNLHSGLYGGAVPNAAHELSNLLSLLHDSKNRITIPGFYTDVSAISKNQKDQHVSLAKNVQCKKVAGVDAWLCEKGNDVYTQVGTRPTLQVTGFHSGYTDEGYSNIVPALATAKINIRLVANQKPTRVIAAIKKHIQNITPEYATVKFEVGDMWDSVHVDTDSDMSYDIETILENIYKKPLIKKFVGGGLPIILAFKKVLKKDPISVSLANEDCNMHGIDENFSIEMVEKGLNFSRKFFGKE